MRTCLSVTRKFGLFFAMALLALQGAPAAADSGSGTFVHTTKGEKPFLITFKDVYAFRAEDTDKNKTQVTVVIFSESPMDKKAMTATLKKERDELELVVDMDPNRAAYARIVIYPNGEIRAYQFYSRRITESSPGGEGHAKVNTATRVEGSYSSSYSGNNWAYKLDLRFATDLADIGPGAPVKVR